MSDLNGGLTPSSAVPSPGTAPTVGPFDCSVAPNAAVKKINIDANGNITTVTCVPCTTQTVVTAMSCDSFGGLNVTTDTIQYADCA